MGKPTQIVRTPPAHQAKVFHQVNPSEIFSDLEEIGHGSFGSVYKVRAHEHEVACRSIACICFLPLRHAQQMYFSDCNCIPQATKGGSDVAIKIMKIPGGYSSDVSRLLHRTCPSISLLASAYTHHNVVLRTASERFNLLVLSIGTVLSHSDSA